MTRRREFCLNYSVYCPAVTVEDVQLFETEMSAAVETPFLSVTEPLPITPRASVGRVCRELHSFKCRNSDSVPVPW